MIKLIATDLDGSLLTDDKQLPPDFWEVADYLLNRGITFLVASGRPFHNLSKVFQRMKDRFYFASDNGTYVVHRGQELLINNLPKDPVNVFIRISRKLHDVYPVLCCKDSAFVENNEPGFMSTALQYYQKYELVKDLTSVDEDVLKLSLCDLMGSERNSYPHYKSFEKDFAVAIAGERWLDITKADGTKGTALKKIQEHLEITPEETIAFGDYMNDFDMLKNADYSYAMKNAHPELIKAARYTTELDNNHFGVTETLKKLFPV